jgi:hypothetical protein
LGLLAQQEIELQVYQRYLYSHGGKATCLEAKQETKAIAHEKYGAYVAYRTDDLLSETSEAGEEEDEEERDEGMVV